MPSIQEIRQSYPQYNDISDDQLLAGLHRRFYSDMPFQDFAGRISGYQIAQTEPAAPQQAATAESVGRTGLQRNIFDPVERGFQNIMIGTAATRATSPDSFFGLNPDEAAESIVRRQRRLGEIPRTEASQRAFREAEESGSIPGAVGRIAGSSSAIGDVVGESFGTNPAAAAVGLAANAIPIPILRQIVGGLAGALGFPTEYASSIGGSLLETAQARGVDVSDPRQLSALIQSVNADPELRSQIRSDALKRAAIISSVDAAAGYGAGRLATRGVAGRIGGGAAVEGVGGGLGEAGAQLATEGQIGNVAEIGAEIVGGGVGGALGNITRATAPVDPEDARRAELRGAIGDVVGAREDIPAGLLAAPPPPREMQDIETPVGNLSRRQMLQFMERRLPAMIEENPEVAVLMASARDDNERIELFRGLLNEREQARFRGLMASSPENAEAFRLVEIQQRLERKPVSVQEIRRDLAAAEQQVEQLVSARQDAQHRLSSIERQPVTDLVAREAVQAEINQLDQLIAGREQIRRQLANSIPVIERENTARQNMMGNAGPAFDVAQARRENLTDQQRAEGIQIPSETVITQPIGRNRVPTPELETVTLPAQQDDTRAGAAQITGQRYVLNPEYNEDGRLIGGESVVDITRSDNPGAVLAYVRRQNGNVTETVPVETTMDQLAQIQVRETARMTQESAERRVGPEQVAGNRAGSAIDAEKLSLSPRRSVDRQGVAKEKITKLTENISKARDNLAKAKDRKDTSPAELEKIKSEIEKLNKQIFEQKRIIASLESSKSEVAKLPAAPDGGPVSKAEFEDLRARERGTKPVTLKDLEARDLAEARASSSAVSVEELIRDFKRGRTRPKGEKSLTQFIVEQGGIRDERGEVRNMLGGNLRARPGLLSRKGLPLDLMAETAREAGYFDDMRPGTLFSGEDRPWQAGEDIDPLDARAFMNALEEDFSGSNKRFGRTEDVTGRERQDAIADLDEYLRGQGIDITSPVDDILRALRQQDPDAPTRTLDDLIESDAAYAQYQDAIAKKQSESRKAKGKTEGKEASPKGGEFSARRVGPEPEAETAPQEQATSNTGKSLAIIRKYLTGLRGKGKQGRLLANALEKLLNDRRFNANQIYAAFIIDNAILKTMPKGANYRFRFLEDIIVDDAEAAKATGAKVGDRAQARVIKPTASLPGFIEISLAEDMLPILNETAAHEAFHVLQDYFGAFDKGFNSLLAKSFEDGMTLDQLEPSIKRRLQGLKAPNSDKSYWTVLKEGLGNNPLSVREAQAYAFGSLTDAAMRGQKVTGLTAPFQRFVNFVRDTFSKLRSGLNGDGYQTAADLFAGASSRAEGFTQAAPTGKAPQTKFEFSARQTGTTTQEFTNWFMGRWNPDGPRGSSVATNKDGSPRVFYHGTPRSFEKFGKARSGSSKDQNGPFFFTEEPEFASDYAESDMSAGGRGAPVKSGAKIYPVYLSAQNPFDYENTDHVNRVMNAVAFSKKDIPQSEISMMKKSISLGMWRTLEKPEVQKAIRNLGFDGFFMKEMGTRNLAVYDPRQVKSIFNNFEEGAARSPEFSARKAPSYSAQKPSAPPGTAKSFYQTVIKDVDNSSVLDRVLSKILDKKGGESIGSAIARTSINQAAPLYNLDKMARAEGYTGLDASKALEMSMSNSGRIAQMLSVGMGKIDPKTGVITLRNDVKPLLQIMKDAGIANNEGMKEQLQAYLAALRERDLRATGRKGFTNETIQAVNATIKEAEAKHPEWKKTAAELDKLNQALIDWALATGLVTRQQARTLMDKFYTPFYREDYEYVTNAVGRELKGGEKALNDLFGNIILNADSIMKAGLKNLATKSAIETMEFVKLAKPNTSDKKNDNTITFKVNGKPVNYDVEDAVLFSALSVMPRQMQHGIYQTMAKMASFFRDMVTVAPSFIIANLYRGKISAFVQEGQPLTTNTFAGMRDALNASTSLQNFQLQTGFGGLEYGMGARNMAEAFERKLNDQGIIKSLAKGKVIQSMKEAFSKMQELSEASEMAERIKLAENLIKKGMKPEDAYFQGYMLAPYTRKGTGQGWLGSTVQFMMPLVPFLNAKIQTTYRLIENEKGDNQKLWTAGIPQQIFLRGLVVTAFSLMAYGLNLADDEDEWDKIPNHMKLEYDMVPFMGSYISLPRAFEIGKIFGALPIFILDAVRRGEGRDLTEALIEVGKSTFWMNPIPKAIDPILAAVTNYDFFRGRPLETKGDEALPVQERINRSTTKTGEALSAVVNTVFGNVLSPIKAQALLDGYTGTLGVTIMAGFDSLLAASGAIPGKPSGAFGDPATMPAILANAAGLNRFYRDGDMMVSRFVGDFYRIKEMTDQLVRSESLARQANDFERLQELRGEEGLPLRMRQTVSAAGTQISEINKRIRMIERQDTDGVSKAQAIQPLIQRRDQIAKRVVDQARNIGVF